MMASEQFGLVESLDIHSGNDREGQINILITNVSTVIPDKERRKREYIDHDNNHFAGEMTNEAPIKSIAYRLGTRGLFLDKILFIESDKVRRKEVQDEDEQEKESHIDFLKKRIDRFLGENRRHTEYIDISIKDEPSKDDVSETVFNIYNRLVEWTRQGSDINIYIESNGGVRYVLTMLLSLTKTLENYYANVHIQEVTSMVLNQSPVRIINTKDVFDTAQITGITSEFVNYGRINGLQAYISTYLDDLNPEQKADVRQMLEKLGKTADNIQLCRTQMILEDFYGADNLKSCIERFTGRYGEDTSAPAVISIFTHILHLILEELKRTVYREREQHHGNPIEYLPEMIEWCLDKSFTQQALTFCAERIPSYLFETGSIRLSDESQEWLDSTDTKGYEKRYYFIAHFHEYTAELEKAYVNAILHEIRTSGNLTMLSQSEWDKTQMNTVFHEMELSDAMRTASENIRSIMHGYYDMANPNNGTLTNLFQNNGFNGNTIHRVIPISKSIKTQIAFALKGQYRDKNGEIKPHSNLTSKKDRIIKVMPALADIALKNEKSETRALEKAAYDSIIDELFPEPKWADLVAGLKDKYSKKQSEKYYVKDAISTGSIITNKSPDDLQRLLYLYSICKEQRNLSNHAHVSEEDIHVAMNSEALNRVIIALLKMC